MVDQILAALTKEIGGSLVSKTGLTKSQAEKAIALTGESTFEVVKNQLGSGNLSSVMNLFSSKPNNAGANLIQNQITSMLSQKLSEHLGLPKDKVSMVVSIALPAAMNYITKLNEKTPENDDSPIKALFGDESKKALTGALGNLAKKFF